MGVIVIFKDSRGLVGVCRLSSVATIIKMKTTDLNEVMSKSTLKWLLAAWVIPGLSWGKQAALKIILCAPHLNIIYFSSLMFVVAFARANRKDVILHFHVNDWYEATGSMKNWVYSINLFCIWLNRFLNLTAVIQLSKFDVCSTFQGIWGNFTIL